MIGTPSPLPAGQKEYYEQLKTKYPEQYQRYVLNPAYIQGTQTDEPAVYESLRAYDVMQQKVAQTTTDTTTQPTTPGTYPTATGSWQQFAKEQLLRLEPYFTGAVAEEQRRYGKGLETYEELGRLVEPGGKLGVAAAERMYKKGMQSLAGRGLGGSTLAGSLAISTQKELEEFQMATYADVMGRKAEYQYKTPIHPSAAIGASPYLGLMGQLEALSQRGATGGGGAGGVSAGGGVPSYTYTPTGGVGGGGGGGGGGQKWPYGAAGGENIPRTTTYGVGGVTPTGTSVVDGTASAPTYPTITQYLIGDEWVDLSPEGILELQEQGSLPYGPLEADWAAEYLKGQPEEVEEEQWVRGPFGTRFPANIVEGYFTYR